MIAFLLFCSFGYTFASCCEWFIHRYCMHAVDNDKVPTKALKHINRQHVIHHNATNTDMSIRPTVDKYKKQGLPMKNQRFQGLYFIWPVNIAIFFGFFFGSFIVNFVVGIMLSPFIAYNVTYKSALTVAMALCLWMNVMWNYVHPTLHLQPGLKLSEGLDIIPRREWMKDTFIYNYLWKHHVLHHCLKGANAGNYNVTLPGADWIFGTLHTECEGFKLDVANKRIYKVEKDEKKQ